VARWIPIFLEMGLNILEPVQVGAACMDPRELAAQYGGKLCFHGSIDTQHTLPVGTPEDVRREVRERVETFLPYGGFTIAPSQHLMTISRWRTSWRCTMRLGNIRGWPGPGNNKLRFHSS
jgi:hypothetical protein